MDLSAYFISPDDKNYIVPSKHIELICDRPELFGLTKEYLESYFRKYDEIWKSEGTARNEIIAELLKKGWVRIRKRSERQRGIVLVFQVNALSKRNKKQIINFIKQGILNGKLETNNLLNIKNIKGVERTNNWTTINDILNNNSLLSNLVCGE